jgi:hypothetical protein
MFEVPSAEYRVPSTEYQSPALDIRHLTFKTRKIVTVNMIYNFASCVVFNIELQAWVPSAEYQVPSARYQVPGTEYRVPSSEAWNSIFNTTLNTHKIVYHYIRIVTAQIIEFRVPSAETQSPRPKNMYTTCPFFTHCTNHQVLSAETRNSKPGVQHVHFSFTFHKSSNSECRGPRPKAWDPKICTQHVHFLLTAQITEFWVQKQKTRNPACNMSIFSFTLHKSSSSVLKPEARDPKICTQHVYFSLTAQITEFKCQNSKLETQCAIKCQVPSAEFQVPSAETRSLGPKNMYTTCSFFTHCTNHRVSSAKVWISKPSVRHVHCSFTLHRSLSSECWVPKPEAWDPKYVCNMSIFHSLHKSPSVECPNLKPGTSNGHELYLSVIGDQWLVLGDRWSVLGTRWSVVGGQYSRLGSQYRQMIMKNDNCSPRQGECLGSLSLSFSKTSAIMKKWKLWLCLTSLPKVVVQVQVSVVVVFSCQFVILSLITQYSVHGNWYSVFGFDTQYPGISSQLNEG